MDPLLEPGSPSRGDPSGPGVGVLTDERPPERPEGPWRGPWYTAAWMPRAVTGLVVTLSSLWVLSQVNPSKVFTSTTPTGGDMGAHVWGPAYLRDHLLPALRLSGWTMDWYAGFPALHFYMPLPYLLIVGLDVVMPYQWAFKLVVIGGLVALPVAAWAMAALARAPFPVPALFAVAATVFVFDTNWSIYGGNTYSTMAGEFAFTIALAVAMVALGLAIRGMNDGSYRNTVGVLLAVTALCHLIPAFFLAVSIVIMLLARGLVHLPRTAGLVGSAGLLLAATAVAAAGTDQPAFLGALGFLLVLAIGLLALVLTARREWRRAWWVASAGLLGMLLSAVWLLPFLWRRDYLNDMGWEQLDQVTGPLFFPDTSSIGWLLTLALIGALVALVRWEWFGVGLVAMALTFWMLVARWPVEQLWNARILPFWYLSLYLLAAYGIGRVVPTVVGIVRDARAARLRLHETVLVWPEPAADDDLPPLPRLVTRPAQTDRDAEPRWAVPAGIGIALVVLVAAVGFTGFRSRVLPFGERDADGVYHWGPFNLSPDEASLASSWVDWNFTGYELKAAYPEYEDVVQTMAQLGESRGCGRALWEYGKDQLDAYGTPMALMLLPHWTEGCIASMEGLYFESSPSVPWHFHMQSELSANPSRPQRGLQYRDLDPDDLESGVQHMQLYGVRYYMAFSDEAVAAAGEHEDLEYLATSGPWVIFEVADSPLVEGLSHEPVVVEGLGNGQDDWLEPTEEWWLNRSDGVTFGNDGPDHWARVELTDDGAIPDLPAEALPAVEVSGVEMGQDWIEFDVDTVGVPVLVKVSYFPNWDVDGARGPWRVAPNLMVVIPEEDHVRLKYRTSGLDLIALGLTAVGILLLILLRRRGRLRVERPTPAPVGAGDDEARFWSSASDPLGPDFSSRAYYGDPVGSGRDLDGMPPDPFDDGMPPDPFTDDGDRGDEAPRRPSQDDDGMPPDPFDDR